MARHRDVRNIDVGEEYGDDDDYYGSSMGSSYQDEVPLSTSVEKEFMFRRNASGTTPKMSHFFGTVPEEEEFPDHRRLRSQLSSDSLSSNSSSIKDFDESELTADDLAKLSTCLENVLDIVGGTVPENMIKEAIVKCNYDVEATINTILNNPKASTPKKSEQPSNEPLPQRAEPRRLVNPIPIPSQQRPEQPRMPFRIPIKTINSGEPPPMAPPPTLKTEPDLLKAANKSSARSRSQSPQSTNNPSPNTSAPPSGSQTPMSSGRQTPVQTPSSSSTQVATPSSAVKQIAMRKGKVDAKAEYKKERGQNKDLINLVVVGHVDSGKSTLMGHMLLSLGNVDKRLWHKYQQESKKLGKQSFVYAWVLDETEQERERGVTMDVGQNKFETPTKNVTLLDAPGHRDFIPNMISGAYQADVAILVVNATTGEFEAGFESGGQTREHALLVRSLGVNQLIVAVNKLDTVGWRQDRFDVIVKKLKTFLKQVGFKEADTCYVPVSGFTGENLSARANAPELKKWYSGKSLLEAIDDLKPPERLVDKPFRMSISDIFKPLSGVSGLSVSGRIESGFVQKDDKVLIMPLNEVATVKSIQSNAETRIDSGFAGDHITLNIIGPEQSSLSDGMVVCDPGSPIAVTKRFRARVVVFNIDVPITKGFPVVLHYGSVQTQAYVKKLVAQIDKSTGEVMQKKPRFLNKNCNAIVELSLDAPVCLELYQNIKELGRFMLRVGSKTVAAGLVTELM